MTFKRHSFLNPDKVIDELICAICQEVASSPMRCGDAEHIFCNACLVESVKQKQQCPLCRCKLTIENPPQKSRLAEALINSLTVSCDTVSLSNDPVSCQWTGKLSDLDQHMRVCDFLPLSCPNKGCDEIVLRRHMDNHRSKCPERSFTCVDCHEVVKCTLKEEHEETCEYRVVDCRNTCGARFPFFDRYDHFKICPFEVIECPFIKSAKCGYLGKRYQMSEHTADIASHFVGLLRKVEELSLEVEELKSGQQTTFR